MNSKNKLLMIRVLQPSRLESKSQGLEKKDLKSRGMHCVMIEFELMVKMGKLVQKFENLFFRNEIPKKMVKQIAFPKKS
jgi:hypothetical protein